MEEVLLNLCVVSVGILIGGVGHMLWNHLTSIYATLNLEIKCENQPGLGNRTPGLYR